MARKPAGRKGKYVGFDKLARQVGSPALAAWIGRKKYGKKKMAQFAKAGRRKKARRK